MCSVLISEVSLTTDIILRNLTTLIPDALCYKVYILEQDWPDGERERDLNKDSET